MSDIYGVKPEVQTLLISHVNLLLQRYLKIESCVNGRSRCHSVKNEANQHGSMVPPIAAADHQLVSQHWAWRGYAVERAGWPVLQRIVKQEF